jgi:hypothetical protein
LPDAHQLAHAHPSGSSADIIAGQILPFAPEPWSVLNRVFGSGRALSVSRWRRG